MAPGLSLQSAALLSILSLLGEGAAQVTNQTGSQPTVTGAATFVDPSGFSTKSYNASAASTTLANDDFSNERLNFLWDQV